MSVNWNAIEREEAHLEEDYLAGRMSYGEYQAAMRDLQNDVRGIAEEDAENAYRDTMGWY